MPKNMNRGVGYVRLLLVPHSSRVNGWILISANFTAEFCMLLAYTGFLSGSLASSHPNHVSRWIGYSKLPH